MTSLLALPNELLQNIACRLPFAGLCNLQRVNKRLHDICNNRLVLLDVVRHGHSNTPGVIASILHTYSAHDRVNLDQGQLDWHEVVSILNNETVETISRIAYAVERCCAAALNHAADDAWTLGAARGNTHYSISEWLPLLLALHHPVTLALEPTRFLRVHGEASRHLMLSIESSPTIQSPSIPSLFGTYERRLEDVANVSFVVNYLTLQRLSTTRGSVKVVGLIEDFFWPSITEAYPAQSIGHATRVEEVLECLCERVPNYGEQHNPFTLPQACTVLLSLIFALIVQFPDPSYHSLPKPRKLCFHKLMDMDSILDNPAENFSTSHFHEMTAPECLSGQWTGYYSDQRGLRSLSDQNLFDPPMCDIRIVARLLSPHDATARGARTKIDRQTRGTDSHGDFLLEGRVYVNGNADIVKTYFVGGHSWVWTGHVTPFGIVGHWGNQWEFGGYFWIWKEEWC